MQTETEAKVFALERPAPALMTYYFITSLVLGPLFFIPLIPLYFRYHTLRYRFDQQGIVMQWGILFRKQVTLTYARIQDIHLTSNLLERWLGLGRVQVQTASAASEAEMTIEGVHEFEMVRDFLYTKMRGIAAAPAQKTAHEDGAGVAGALREVAAELRALRSELAGRSGK